MGDIKYTNGAFDVSYDSYYSCHSSGCNDEGICRCRRISNVSAVIEDAYEAYKYLIEAGLSPTLNYSFLGSQDLDYSLFPVKQFFNNSINVKCLHLRIDYTTCGDYYGDELGDVNLENELELLNDINSQLFSIFGRSPDTDLDHFSDTQEIQQYVLELIKFSLSTSNDNIKLSELDTVTKYSIMNTHLLKMFKDIIIPNTSRLNTIRKTDWNKICELRSFVSSGTSKNNNGIMGILMKRKKDKLYLIDGYRRYAAMMLFNPDNNVSYLVLE